MTEPNAAPEPAESHPPFVESEREGTRMAYEPAGRVPLLAKALWVAFALFFVGYMARVYVPALLRAMGRP